MEKSRFNPTNVQMVAELAAIAITELSETELSSEDWHDRAICRRFDPGLFYPEDSGKIGAKVANVGKAVCSYCPVRQDCLTESLQNREDFGIWGGMDRNTRLNLLRNSKKAA